MKSWHESFGQSVTGEKDVPCFGEPVLQRIVRIAEARRNGYVALPIQVGVLVVPQTISYNCAVSPRQ